MRIAIVAALLLSASTGVRADSLLGRLSVWTGFTGNGPATPEYGVRYYITTGWYTGPAFGLETTPRWYEGQSGNFEFTAANTPSFAALAASCTDGVNDLLFSCWSYSPGSVSCFGTGEAAWFGTSTDLIGCELNRISLQVQDVHFRYQGTLLYCDSTVTWEFWGTPEPASAALLLLGALVLRRRSA
jgi:hypothetical protein